MFQAEPAVFLFGALLILTLPLNWVVSVLSAAVFHELCHLLTLRLLGGRVYQIRIGISGAVMEGSAPSVLWELISIAAGPAGSLLLAALSLRRLPRLAICAAAQGCFNLLPVYPLDGGRMLRLLLEKTVPKYAEPILTGTEAVFFLSLLGVVIVFSGKHSLGYFPILLCCAAGLRFIRRKRPCKQGENRVQ